MTQPTERDDQASEIDEHEDLDIKTIVEDAEELFRQQAPDGTGDRFQPDNPPPAT